MVIKKSFNNREDLLKKGEVSLILDAYEDIFSDFDPRPSSQRALSVDFLDEAKRATRESEPGSFELNFLVPAKQKNFHEEEVIRGRLKEHFRKHTSILESEKRKVLKQGYFFLFIGFIFMFAAAYVLFYFLVDSFLIELLVVVLEPGGWFLFWEGLDLIVFEAKRNKSDIEFYKKMTKANIAFSHY